MENKREVIAKIEGIEKLILERMEAIEVLFGVKLENILAQTTKTNGRVTKLEERSNDFDKCKEDVFDLKCDFKTFSAWKNYLTGAIVVISSLFFAIIVPLVISYIKK